MRIAFIGLGAMGLPMARRLSAAEGVELVLFDSQMAALDRARDLGRLATSVEDALHEADAVFTVLPADAHVTTVAEQVATHGRAGQVYVDFSTIGPATMVSVVDRLRKVDIETISLAMTRSTAAAASGELVLFGGGLENMTESLERALGAVAVEVRDLGSAAAAKAMKLANNMVVSCLDVAICEAMVLGRGLGLDPVLVLETMKEHGADSWPLRNHIEKYVLPDDLGPGRFSTSYMAKDVRLYSEAALAGGVPSFFAGVALAEYRGVVAHGWRDHYHMIVVRWLEEGAALTTTSRPDGHLDEAGRAEGLAKIARGMAALGVLVTEDALATMSALGVLRVSTAGHLQSGSAGSDYLTQLLVTEDGRVPLDFEQMSEDLRAVTDLAEGASVPSVMFETGLRVAVAGK